MVPLTFFLVRSRKEKAVVYIIESPCFLFGYNTAFTRNDNKDQNASQKILNLIFSLIGTIYWIEYCFYRIRKCTVFILYYLINGQAYALMPAVVPVVLNMYNGVRGTRHRGRNSTMRLIWIHDCSTNFVSSPFNCRVCRRLRLQSQPWFESIYLSALSFDYLKHISFRSISQRNRNNSFNWISSS